MPHVVACPMSFNLLCDQDQQEGVFKTMNNNQLLVVFGDFSEVFGQIKD